MWETYIVVPSTQTCPPPSQSTCATSEVFHCLAKTRLPQTSSIRSPWAVRDH